MKVPRESTESTEMARYEAIVTPRNPTPNDEGIMFVVTTVAPSKRRALKLLDRYIGLVMGIKKCASSPISKY